MAARPRPEPALLENRLGHAFRDPDLLEEALTHVSAGTGSSRRSNQRFEFLGDRVLGLAVADGLIAGWPGADEGELSRRLSGLVRRETCAAVALAWQVGPHLRLGPGEARSGGRANASILADACEAILGAIFLDAGYEAVRAVVARDFVAREPGPEAAPDARDGKDAKTALQEWAQGLGLPPPRYELVERTGPDHAPSFSIAARVEGIDPGIGRGGSKRLAEQDAARVLLAREGVWAEEGAVPKAMAAPVGEAARA